MSVSPDRLYELLPAIHRERDARKGWPLRALLQVIAEQVDVIEGDVEQLYDNWFIETCQDWVVPYIGELIGYRPVHDAGEPIDVRNARDRVRNRFLIPRRDVAKTIANRRRKGTLALLEDLAHDVAGWRARAVELDRDPAAVEDPNDPADPLAPIATLPALATRIPALGASPDDVGLFVWRLQSYPVAQTKAYSVDFLGGHGFTFSALGNDVELFTAPPAHPMRIRRDVLAVHKERYIGAGKSIEIWTGSPRDDLRPVPPSDIEVVDLAGWRNAARYGTIALDPELGRIAFPSRHGPSGEVWVRYHYGGVTSIGGGEYRRPIPARADATVYRVAGGGPFDTIADALEAWRREHPAHGIIEIAESGVFTEALRVVLPPDAALQIRAADGTRPILRVLNVRHPEVDAIRVEAGARSELVLDGLLVGGRGVRIAGEPARVTIRHCTFVPGWDISDDAPGGRYTEPSLDLRTTTPCVRIERSIIGPIVVNVHEVLGDPLTLCIADSILDATATERVALSGPPPRNEPAFVSLSIARSTVFGRIDAHAIGLAENTIFVGALEVARRQVGCVRFCYVASGSATPRRFHCQPETPGSSVEPVFDSTSYGDATYARLAFACPEEIRHGADDASEMGAYHDVFAPHRHANLQARLDEYIPVGMQAGIYYVT